MSTCLHLEYENHESLRFLRCKENATKSTNDFKFNLLCYANLHNSLGGGILPSYFLEISLKSVVICGECFDVDDVNKINNSIPVQTSLTTNERLQNYI